METWDLLDRGHYVFRRWWWLVVLAGLVSGTTAGYLVHMQPPQYLARTTLMVGNNLRSVAPKDNLSGVSLTLAGFYAEMARRRPITEPVIHQLQLPFSADLLSERMIATRVIPQAQLIELTVLDTNPERAAHIANALAQQLIAYSPTSPEKIESQREFTQTQIEDLASKIKGIDQQIDQLKGSLQSMTSAGEIAEAQQRLRELETIKATDQATYQGLLDRLNDSAINSLAVFEPAEPPATPLPRRLFPIVALAALLGLAIGMAAAWLLETWDDIWSRQRRTDVVVGQPLLATIPTGWSGIVSDSSLATPRGQQCLALRAELLLQLASAERSTIMVTSAYATLERSRLSSDIARLFARSGQQTLLVDANLASDALSAMFQATGAGIQALLRDPDQPVAALLWATEQPELALLPGDAHAPNAQLVPALHWPHAVQAIAEQAEVTIFDGPAVLIGADATLLAPHVTMVLLVIDPAIEGVADTRRALARLSEAGARVVGLVLLDHDRRSRPAMARSAAPQPATLDA